MAMIQLHALSRPASSGYRFSRNARKIQSSSLQRYMHTFSSYLITPDELHTALQTQSPTEPAPTKPSTPTSTSKSQSRILPLSAAWFLPNDSQSRTGRSSFRARHIPGSLFFDLDLISDTTSPYPHMLPTSGRHFARAMRNLGIRRTDTVVVYDTAELGIFSAPRVAWTFRVFGHPRVHVLNNFRIWVERGLPVACDESLEHDKDERKEEEEEEEEEESQMLGSEHEQYPMVENKRDAMVASFEDVRNAVTSQANSEPRPLVLDARSRGRWEGTQPEPRPGLSSGHMPHSASLPFSELLDPATKAFLPAPDLRAVLEKRGVELSASGSSSPVRSVISSCGTGVTAAVIDTALAEIGFPEERKLVYDGSWTEWAQRARPEEQLILKEKVT